MKATGFERLTSVSNEPYSNEYLERMHIVPVEQLISSADEAHPLVRDNLPTRLLIEKKPHYTADSSNQLIYPASVTRWPKQVIDRAMSTLNNEISLLHSDRIIVPKSQQYDRIQRSDLKDVKLTEDTQVQSGVYPEPADQSQELDAISSPDLERPDQEYVGQMPARTSGQSKPVYSGHWLGNKLSPVNEMPVVSPITIRKPLITTRQIAPWSHPLSVLQRSYLKARDKAIEIGSKAIQLTHVIKNLGVDEATEPDKEPIRNLGSYYSPYLLPDRGLPTTFDTIISRTERIARPGATMGTDKPVTSLLSSSTLDRYQSSDILGDKIIPHRVSERQQPEQSVTPVSPLAEPWVEGAKIQKSDEELESKVPERGIRTLFILPASEADVLTGFSTSKSETPILNIDSPSTTELYREKLMKSTGDTELLMSPVVKYLKSVKGPPVDSSISRSVIQRQVKEPASPLSKYNYRSLELLFASSAESRTVTDATRSKGVLPRIFEESVYYDSQMTREPAIIQERHHAEALSPELSLVQTKSHVESVPPEPALHFKRSQTEETSPAPSGVERATGEVEAGLDMDAVARDVYIILKRRLFRERERAFGLS